MGFSYVSTIPAGKSRSGISKALPLPSISFSIYYSLITLPFDAVIV
jgi:hypothetical protein